MEKAYIDMQVFYTKDGVIKPIELIWEDEKRYKIDRIIAVDNKAYAGLGIRYTVRINGKQAYVYFDDYYKKWYVIKR